MTALCRASDPLTCYEAADRVPVNQLEGRVLEALRQSIFGLTTREIAREIGLERDSVSPRMKPLLNRGLVERTDVRRGGCCVWRAV